MTRFVVALAVLSLAGLAACGGDDDPHEHHNHDHGDEELNLTRTATTDGGTWTVSYTPSVDPIAISENFTVTVSLDSGNLEGATVEFDAMMPAHNHGMNTQAQASDNGDGTWLVEGMLFHMPGHWRMMADVSSGDVTETAIFDVEL